MPSPFFSVIIPTLNEAFYLPHLLKDLSRQTFKDFEVIVVDAQSNDQTLSLAKTFEKKLPSLTLLSTPHKNVAYQRNLGAHHARGKLFVFSDADNRFPPFFLVGLKYRFDAHRPDIFTCYLLPDSQKPSDLAVASLINLSLELSARLIEKPAGLGALLCCRREVFHNNQGFDDSIRYAEDREFVQRCVRHGARYLIFKDPRFICSFRRLRKEGKLRLLKKFAQVNLKVLKEGYPRYPPPEYPLLGGNFYHSTEKPSPPSKKLKNLYQKLLTLLRQPPTSP